jgi:hypothetical protein
MIGIPGPRFHTEVFCLVTLYYETNIFAQTLNFGGTGSCYAAQTGH